MQSIKIVCGAGGLGDPQREHCFEERLIIFKMINNFKFQKGGTICVP